MINFKIICRECKKEAKIKFKCGAYYISCENKECRTYNRLSERITELK